MKHQSGVFPKEHTREMCDCVPVAGTQDQSPSKTLGCALLRAYSWTEIGRTAPICLRGVKESGIIQRTCDAVVARALSV
jgi:hypothetical protein